METRGGLVRRQGGIRIDWMAYLFLNKEEILIMLF